MNKEDSEKDKNEDNDKNKYKMQVQMGDFKVIAEGENSDKAMQEFHILWGIAVNKLDKLKKDGKVVL